VEKKTYQRGNHNRKTGASGVGKKDYKAKISSFGGIAKQKITCEWGGEGGPSPKDFEKREME